MAQLKEKLEPYVKVYERIKTTTLVPQAGEDLIIGVTLISDSGPYTPTLITSQRDFLNTYASRDITKDYINSLNNFYQGDVKDLASTMWLNAYRLAGSTNMLVVRASKGAEMSYVKPLVPDSNNNDVYIIRDGQLLKKVQDFKLVIDNNDDNATHPESGWAMSINEVGVVGNLTSDLGPIYDYFVRTLPELVEYLNDSPKFFSPDYAFYKTARIEDSNETTDEDEAKCVYFKEVYIAPEFLDVTGFDSFASNADSQQGSKLDGLAYLTVCQKDWSENNPTQDLVNLNQLFSSDQVSEYYAVNVYNSNTDLKVRIRRFNHDAVVTKDVAPSVEPNGESPYRVLTNVLEVLGNNNTERDFYEVAVLDPSIDSDPLIFNIGNVAGRGDMTVEEVNESLKMINLVLPDDMSELGLNYYGLETSSGDVDTSNDDPIEVEPTVYTITVTQPEEGGSVRASAESAEAGTEITLTSETTNGYYFAGWVVKDADSHSVTVANNKFTMPESNVTVTAVFSDDIEKQVSDGGSNLELYNGSQSTSSGTGNYNQGDLHENPSVGNNENSSESSNSGDASDEADQIYVDLSLDTESSSILSVNDADLMKSMSTITEDEVYTVEGLSDLGNTTLAFQTYLCNMAKNENYFYPISTVNSTNYLAIANYRSKLAQDSYKLYTSAPWDIDTGTVGFKFYAAPSVIYWEAVSKNRSMDREFASVFGYNSTGQVLYTKPVTEFTKKQRQLLLSKQINTVMWNTQNQTWNMNDCYTMTSEPHILNEDGNSRLFIRINKAIPTLLKPLIGRKINDVTYADAEDILKFWFKRTIQPMQYTVDDYRITVANLEANDDEARRQNKMYVLVECRFARSLKYIIVYSDAIDMGMEFTGEI